MSVIAIKDDPYKSRNHMCMSINKISNSLKKKKNVKGVTLANKVKEISASWIF